MEMGALSAALEPSSLTPSLLLLSASSAQLDEFLAKAQLVVPPAPMDSLRPALDLLSAFQKRSFAHLVSSLMETSAPIAALEPSSLTPSLLLLCASCALLERFLGVAQVNVKSFHNADLTPVLLVS